MMDRTYGVSTSELRGENRNFEREEYKRNERKLLSSENNFKKISNISCEIIKHSLDLKVNPLKGNSELKHFITFALLKSDAHKSLKVKSLMEFKLDPACKETLELTSLKYNSQNVYKVYLAAIQFSKLVADAIPFSKPQVEQIESIANAELMKSIDKAFGGKDLDTKTLVYLAKSGLLK